MKLVTNSKGFTLIEVMVALGVFSVGFVAFLMMTTTAIRGSANASRINDAGNWAGDRLESLLRMPYDSGTNGLDDDGDTVADNNEEQFDAIVDDIDDMDRVDGAADYSITSPDNNYTIYWNVAQNEPGMNMKTVRVIVRNRLLGTDLAFTTIKILNQ
jgi:type IV pilus assembly protein PilV